MIDTEEMNVSYTVIVSFDRDREYEIMLHDGDIQGMDRDRARAWLAGESLWEVLGPRVPGRRLCGHAVILLSRPGMRSQTA